MPVPHRTVIGHVWAGGPPAVAANLAQSPLPHRIGLFAGQPPVADGHCEAEVWHVPSEQMTPAQGVVSQDDVALTQLPSLGHLNGVAVGQPTEFGHGVNGSEAFVHELSEQRSGRVTGQPLEGRTTLEQFVTVRLMHAPLEHLVGISDGQPEVMSMQN